MASTEQAPRGRAGLEPGFRVIWLGERPWWLDDSSARAELDDVEPGPPHRHPRPFVVHARASALPGLRHAENDRLVADLSGCARLDRVSRRVAGEAAVVIVDDPQRLRLLGDRPRGVVVQLRPPIDVAATNGHVGEQAERELRRFRRAHRLTGRTLLYAGPYRPAGGLHLLLDVVAELRARYDDLVLAAIPEGPVDARYRAACERQALTLGHRAVVEWGVLEHERPLWYGTAIAVCLPATHPLDDVAAVRAAAAGVPFVATRVDPFPGLPTALAPDLVAPGDRDALALRLDALVSDPESARAAGRTARLALEDELGPAGAARRLRAVWSSLGSGDRGLPGRAPE